MSRTLQSLALLSMALWVALIGLLTLSAGGQTSPLTLERFLCLACGELDAADIIANWLLFLPLGALGALTLGAGRGVLIAIGLSAAVEIAQIAIPGRYPALQDVVFNTLGAASGAALVLKGLGPRMRVVVAGVAAAAWLAPVVLLVPRTSTAEPYVLLTPSFGGVEQYRGRVLDATLGGLPVRNGLVPNREPLDSALTERRRIEMTLEVGPSPQTVAPVLAVVDGNRTTLLSLGARGQDLLLVGNNPATTLGFAQPPTRWPGALAGVTAGDTVRLVVERGRSSGCMSVGPSSACDLAPSLADGWRLLILLGDVAGWLGWTASVLWAAGLGALLGVGAGSPRRAAVAGGALAGFGMLLSALSPDVRPDAVHALILAASCVGAPFARSFFPPRAEGV